MLSYILKRIFSLLPVMFVVSVVIFLVVYLIPGGPATAMLGLEASPQQIAELNAQLGFDRPFLVQYADWLTGVFRGDWGQSYFLDMPVLQAIGEYFIPTLSLAVLAQVVALVFAIPMGCWLLTNEAQRWIWPPYPFLCWVRPFPAFCSVCSLCFSLAYIFSGCRWQGMSRSAGACGNICAI